MKLPVVLLLFVAGGAAGCSGSTASPVGGSVQMQQASAQKAPLTLKFTLPSGHASSAQSLAGRGLRNPKYIATTTGSLTVGVTSQSGQAQTPVTVPCSAVCSTTLQAPVGTDAISLSLFDTANGTGNLLSTVTTSVSVMPSIVNSLRLTANPVIASAVISPAAPTIAAGTAVDIPLTITALDADGNTIVGPGHYVDGNGQPVTLSLTANNVPNSGTSPISFSESSFTDPTVTSVTAHYDGDWLGSSAFALTSSSSAVTTLAGSALSLTPSIQEISGLSGSALYDQMALGPDGNIWFCEPGANKIGRITTAGVVTEFATGISPGAVPNGITAGPDGNMWFTEGGIAGIAKITTSGVVTEYFAGISPGAYPWAITTGPDGNLWFTEYSNNVVGRISSTGVVHEFSFPSFDSNANRDIVAGPDGNLWMANGSIGYIAVVSPTGVLLHQYYIGPAVGITVGPDGNMWATVPDLNTLERITMAGTLTPFPVPGRPFGITVGSDNNLWVTEEFGNHIDRVTTTGAVTQFGAGISPGAQAYVITRGSDGNLWFGEQGYANIGKLSL